MYGCDSARYFYYQHVLFDLLVQRQISVFVVTLTNLRVASMLYFFADLLLCFFVSLHVCAFVRSCVRVFIVLAGV